MLLLTDYCLGFMNQSQVARIQCCQSYVFDNQRSLVAMNVSDLGSGKTRYQSNSTCPEKVNDKELCLEERNRAPDPLVA